MMRKLNTTWGGTMALALALLLVGCEATAPLRGNAAPSAAESRITILYDAFGQPNALRKDWGFAALVEVGGKRILFDTGDDAETFAHNTKALGVDLTRLDFVVMSHRHGDHMGGLAYLLEVNPGVKIYAPKEGFGVYGGSLPGSFYRRDASLPADMRYYAGAPPELLRFGSAWPKANFELIDETTEVAPGVTLIALVSEAPGTRELKELSLAIRTPQGIVLVVGCSHPGIEAIVAQAAKIDPRIHAIAGGFHLVVAQDEVIDKVTRSLRERQVEYVAPGHCTGEPTFAALQKAFGERYLFAGLGSTLSVGEVAASRQALPARAAEDDDEPRIYRRLAAHEAHHGSETMMLPAGIELRR